MQRLGYCLMEKIRNVLYKDWQGFFFENKKNFSSHLNKFYSGRNDFSPLSVDYLKKQRKNKSALFV